MAQEIKVIEYYSTSTLEQLSTEFVVTSNVFGKPVLRDISRGKPSVATESHLLKRARMIEGVTRTQSASSVAGQLHHIRREVYDPMNVDILIDEHNGMHDLNTYRYPINPYTKQDFYGGVNETQCPPMFNEYMKRMFPDPSERLFMFRWIARSVAIAWYKMRVAIIIRGVPGCGKSLLVDFILAALCGRDNVLTTKLAHITGNFNAGIDECVVCCLDEAYDNKKSIADKLKKVVSDDDIVVTKKHNDPGLVKSYANIIILSNSEHPIFIEDNDRRYFVTQFIEHAYSQEESAEFTARFVDWFKTGGCDELYFYFHYFDEQHRDNERGFQTCIKTQSHSDIKTLDIQQERLDDLVAYLGRQWVTRVKLTALKAANPFIPQPAIVKVLKELGFKNKTVNENGSRQRMWVKEGVGRYQESPQLPAVVSDLGDYRSVKSLDDVVTGVKF